MTLLCDTQLHSRRLEEGALPTGRRGARRRSQLRTGAGARHRPCTAPGGAEQCWENSGAGEGGHAGWSWGVSGGRAEPDQEQDVCGKRRKPEGQVRIPPRRTPALVLETGCPKDLKVRSQANVATLNVVHPRNGILLVLRKEGP